MNGILKLPLHRGRCYVVAGGPYRDMPEGYHGVKMAAEIDKPSAISIPTRDFSVPNPDDLRQGLHAALVLIGDGEPLYVGCMGGMGRTGLFLAVLARAWGIQDPVAYVRKHYYPHAVETAAQYAYVKSFHIPEHTLILVRKIQRRSWYKPLFGGGLQTKGLNAEAMGHLNS